MTLRHLSAAAVLAGIVAGGSLAAVQASGQGQPPVPPPAATAQLAPRPPAPVVPNGRIADGRYDHNLAHVRVDRSTVRESARVKDPAGGPDWVLRSFDAERVTLQRPARSLRAGRVVGRNRCVQLGREQGGRFGWIYGDGRFRPTTVYEYGLILCGSRRKPVLQRENWESLDLTDFAAPKVTSEVLWGEAPNARQLALDVTRGADGPVPLGARNGFLVVAPRGAGLSRGMLVIDGGRRVAVRPLAGRTTVRPGSQKVEARTPDPAGGPPRGLLAAQLEDGTPCVAGAGQIVEDRLGGVDSRLGTFLPASSRSCESQLAKLPGSFACAIGTGFGSEDGYGGGDPLLRRARIERRLLTGRLTVSATCRPGVERVTLRTPRDIRTLKPSPVARAIFAIYDGDFVAGELEFTAHFSDGRTWKQRFPLGF